MLPRVPVAINALDHLAVPCIVDLSDGGLIEFAPTSVIIGGRAAILLNAQLGYELTLPKDSDPTMRYASGGAALSPAIVPAGPVEQAALAAAPAASVCCQCSG